MRIRRNVFGITWQTRESGSKTINSSPAKTSARMSNGRLQVSGQVAVMEINGLLAKIIFDKNPDREFYIEESFPLDWMYPHLEPHGLIMKINRQPLAGLSDEIIQKDNDYWIKYMTPMIGDWLKPTHRSRTSSRSRKKFISSTIWRISKVISISFKIRMHKKCFPNCGVRSAAFTHGARNMPLMHPKRNA